MAQKLILLENSTSRKRNTPSGWNSQNILTVIRPIYAQNSRPKVFYLILPKTTEKGSKIQWNDRNLPPKAYGDETFQAFASLTEPDLWPKHELSNF